MQLLSLYNVITHKNTIIKSVSSMLISQPDQDVCCTAPIGKTNIQKHSIQIFKGNEENNKFWSHPNLWIHSNEQSQTFVQYPDQLKNCLAIGSLKLKKTPNLHCKCNSPIQFQTDLQICEPAFQFTFCGFLKHIINTHMPVPGAHR